MKRRDELALRLGYWCQCTITFFDSTRGSRLVTAFDARSASEAVVSIIVAMEMTTPYQHESEAAAVRAWADRTQAVSSLIGGQTCTYTVDHGDLHLTWTIRPALFLPLADRKTIELPTCAKRFTTYPFKPALPPLPGE
ncbi:hypothetical protein GCM10020221_22770 [Streptomyces thioluteus]|uniref:Uncharacterized protein n=1 Tax=Streptomyces thioluteus TaxID=66431 RepID=A0ABP6JCF2_STRTU